MTRNPGKVDFVERMAMTEARTLQALSYRRLLAVRQATATVYKKSNAVLYFQRRNKPRKRKRTESSAA